MRRMLWLVLFIVIAEAAGIAGSFITIDAIPAWYDTLTLPSFAPPKWLFGPVWTTLYALMGIAAFLVWDAERGAAHTKALRAYWIQLALNALWTPIFFGLKDLRLAFVEILFLLAAIIITMRRFFLISRIAALLLAPYLLWVSFASLLNLAIAYLNQA